MTTACGLEVAPPEATIVQRRRDEDAVEPEVREPLDLPRTRHPAARKELNGRVLAPQRLQTDDDLRGARRADGARPHGVGDAGVHEQAAAEARQPSQQGALHQAAADGVEIGDIAVLEPEGVAIGPGQRDRVARSGLGIGEHRSDGRVARAPASAGQHSAPGAQVEHGDYAQ